MMNEYNKLVRDRIPEIIHRAGEHYAVEVMTEEKYQQALRQKLVEEASEAAQAQTSQELVTELADLQEVIDTLITTSGLSREMIMQEQERRRTERGGFEQRLRLHWAG